MLSPSSGSSQLRKASRDFALEGAEQRVELHGFLAPLRAEHGRRLRPPAARTVCRSTTPVSCVASVARLSTSGGASTVASTSGLAAGPGPSRLSVRCGSGSASACASRMRVDRRYRAALRRPLRCAAATAPSPSSSLCRAASPRRGSARVHARLRRIDAIEQPGDQHGLAETIVRIRLRDERVEPPAAAGTRRRRCDRRPSDPRRRPDPA